ncbi:MAG TPA: hypothetical protein VH041_02500 [Caldimonas sp.]|jgi:hypothetical protein|nr:hypothetical protein [Caldimonas sp.]HEX4233151.1 hypothetical protein [Caldimonas sp.]
MSGWLRRLLVAAGGLACATLCSAAPDFATELASDDARYAADWILGAADHEGRPFAVVDKKAARIYVFDSAGHLIGASSALLGAGLGDLSVPDIASRSVRSLSVAERTTPAGRFDSVPGHNDKGEAIVWIDYDAAVAIHRLRPSPASERRAERLASPSAADKRISFGCIVVPVAFYESIVAPTLGRQRGVVYVLPEIQPVRAMFDAVASGLGVD